jgi:hypothetical protein
MAKVCRIVCFVAAQGFVVVADERHCLRRRADGAVVLKHRRAAESYKI